jgi:hypothetical protein
MEVSMRVAGVTALAVLAGCNLLYPYQPESLCENRVRAMCKFAFTCCNPNERDAINLHDQYASEGDCVEDQLKNRGACTASQSVQESVDEGRFEYDEELARKCNEALLDALNTCDAEKIFDADKLDLDEDCKELAAPDAYGKGLVKDGDACMGDYECKDEGALCVIDTPEDPDKVLVTAVGECEAPQKIGEDCSEGQRCEKGSTCDGNECVELLDDGEPCFFDGECKSDNCDLDALECTPREEGDDVSVKVEICDGDGDDDTDF